MKYVKVSAKVERRIKSLRQSSKEGKMIAHRVRGTIEDLKSGAILDHMEPNGSYTKYGEKRIKRCRKFNFGCGYRLITLHRGLTIFVPFLGSHDECQRWLENNSRLKDFDTGKGRSFRVSDKKSISSGPSKDQAESFYDEENEINLNERELRTVFCGLVEGVQKRVR